MAGSTPLTRSLATNPMTVNGMVTSPHYLATQAGLDLLRQGATAFEAAIAVATTLTVVYPHMCTLGGDAFWLVYSAQDRKLRALNASGRAGEEVCRERYTDLGYTSIPTRGPLAANTVPGLVSGLKEVWNLSRSLGGTRSVSECLASAVAYATEGVPAPSSFVAYSSSALSAYQKDPSSYAMAGDCARILFPEGRSYRIGEVFSQPDLAQTLDILCTEGFESFYTGSLAERLVAGLKALGGLLTARDFATHSATWVEPISVPYRDCIAYNTPPNTQGMASLAILHILDTFDLSGISPDSADYYHLLVEATKEAFRDRDRYLSDPDFVQIPLTELLSREHALAQARRIKPKRANPSPGPLDPAGDTVWFGLVDKFGNAVSCIQSVYYDFGACVVPAGTGIFLQNRGSYFSLDPAHVNCLAPGKRTFHTLNPAMLFKNDRPYLIYGTMGGEGQPQTQAQVVTRIVEYGMYPQEAIYAPRFLFGRAFGAPTNALCLESRISRTVQEELREMGHAVQTIGPFSSLMGHAGAILLDQKTNVLYGGADPRGDGLAAGF